MENNKYGLSKKANVAMASVTAITVITNAEFWQSVIGIIAVLGIGIYHLYNQSRIDRCKDSQ